MRARNLAEYVLSMAKKKSERRERYEERSGYDRRVADDRRKKQVLIEFGDRRSGADRRKEERREGGDRRVAAGSGHGSDEADERAGGKSSGKAGGSKAPRKPRTYRDAQSDRPDGERRRTYRDS